MTTLEILLIGLALALAIWNVLSIAALKSEAQRANFGVEAMQASIRSLREEVERALQVTRGHLARVSTGERVDPEIIRDGLPFGMMPAAEAQKIHESSEPWLLLDVRTTPEYARGHIPGAKLIPVEDLERRIKELPQDKGTPIIVHCQSGGRSMDACEFLSSAGYSTLHNMVGGFGAWRGAVEQGTPLSK